MHRLQTRDSAAFLALDVFQALCFGKHYVFLFVHFVDLLQLLLTAVDSVK